MMKDKSYYFVMASVFLLILGISFLSFIFSSSVENYFTGKVTSMAFIKEPEFKDCSVLLLEGVNYVSFNCEIGRPLNEALQNSKNETLNYSVVYSYNSLDSSPWRIYHSDLPSWVTLNLDSLYRNRGYVIVMDNEGSYNYTGIYSFNTNLQLRKGWNLVGYPLNTKRNVSKVLTSIENEFIQIKTYDELSGSWKSYGFGISNNLEILEPMKSYWINVKEDVLWVIN